MASAAEVAVNILTKLDDSGLKESESKFGKFQGKLGTAAKVSAGALLGLGAAAISSAKAAAEDQQAQVLLANTLKNTGASKAQTAAVEDQISAMSKLTGITDDELRPAYAAIQRSTKDTAKSTAALNQAMDIATATGKPLSSVSEAIAKGYAGNTTALGKLVPGIDKATLASKDMTKIMGELGKTTGGAAADAADTTAGKFKKFQTQMGEAQEAIGAGLLPILSILADKLEGVATWVGENSTAFGIIVGIIAAFAAVIVTLNAVVKIATSVQAAYNLIMLANPTVLIVLAIIAAVAALVLIFTILWKKSDVFKKAITGAFNAVLGAAKAAWQWIKSNWPLLLAILTGPIGLAVLAIVKNWDRIKAAAVAVYDWIKGTFNKVWKTVSDAAKSALDLVLAPIRAITTAFEAVVTAIKSVIEWIKKIKIPKIKIPGLGTIGGSAAAAPAPSAAGFSAPKVAAGARSVSTSSGASISITVNGAIDPEGTARQIRRILAGHDRRIGLAIS